MADVGYLLAAVNTSSPVYEWARGVGAIALTVAFFVRVFRSPAVRLKAVLLAVGGVLLVLSVLSLLLSALMLATGTAEL